jgi:hypothetical protein
MGGRTHGMTGTSEYRVWRDVRQRTTNPRCDAWSDYGGRGITLCERWRNSFEAFYSRRQTEYGRIRARERAAERAAKRKSEGRRKVA